MTARLQKAYRKLYAFFGPQDWWPAKSRFEVIVGAILTQNTSWKNVEKAIKNLRKEKALSARKLYLMPVKKLARLIRPAGFFNLKAGYLKAFLEFYFKTYCGSLKKMARQDTAVLRKQLLGVKGIGEETADSILLYALDKPVFVVDAYTKRIFSRHKMVKNNSPYQAVQNLFSQNLEKEVKLFNEYHALLVKLAKEYCLKGEPQCALCPVKGF